MADGDGARAHRVHHRVHLPEMHRAGAFPRRQNSQVEHLGVLTASDLFPATVPQVADDLLVAASTREGLATAEDTTLSLRDQSEPLVHSPSIQRPGIARAPCRTSVDKWTL